jgi:hypothetical protein
MEPTTKPGTKTTEFWVALAPVAIGMVEGSKNDPETNRYLILAGAILGGIYIISRTLVKWKSK